MDYFTHSVQKIKANQNLFCQLPYCIYGKSLVVGSLQDLKQVNSQNFIHHAEMISIWSFIEKAIEKIENMGIISVDFLGFFALVLSDRIDPFRFGGKLCYFL